MNLSEQESCLQQVASRGLCSAAYVTQNREACAAGNRLVWTMLPLKSPCNFPELNSEENTTW